jgi:hypothetical protein
MATAAGALAGRIGGHVGEASRAADRAMGEPVATEQAARELRGLAAGLDGSGRSRREEVAALARRMRAS